VVASEASLLLWLYLVEEFVPLVECGHGRGIIQIPPVCSATFGTVLVEDELSLFASHGCIGWRGEVVDLLTFIDVKDLAVVGVVLDCSLCESLV